mmetsp:Transcript_29259/g.44906  ORF Transcript_29259/g.44906 Transcript_29259/m.44906 type:complete len:124 (-) Transcript_29259:10-381(-)
MNLNKKSFKNNSLEEKRGREERNKEICNYSVQKNKSFRNYENSRFVLLKLLFYKKHALVKLQVSPLTFPRRKNTIQQKFCYERCKLQVSQKQFSRLTKTIFVLIINTKYKSLIASDLEYIRVK